MKPVFLCLATLVSCASGELTMEALTRGLQAHPEAFESRSPGTGGKAQAFEIKLGDTVTGVDDVIFDGFRFRYPEEADGGDFVWYFNAPAGWADWSILPAEGQATDGFKSGLLGDKLYVPFDKAGEEGRKRILQTLKGGYFKKGAEYILWFGHRAGSGAGDGVVRGTMAFARSEKWDHEAIEKALHLDPAPVEDQMAELNWRGGRILLDDHFFSHAEAEKRIEAVIAGIRATTLAKGGLFITMKQPAAPCATHPSMDEIAEKYGAADFVVTSKEARDRLPPAERAEKDDATEDYTTYFYDRFGFQVLDSDPARKVERMLTQAEDFSPLAAPKEGSHYVSAPMENLTVFYRGGKEVGRAYFFMDDDSNQPAFVTEPPPGTYQGSNAALICKGGGKWTLESYFGDGKVSRRIPLEGNLYEGESEAYYPSGSKRSTAPYKGGVLNGEVIQYDEEGKEKGRRKFKDGKAG
ncbi:MAG: hypothetical protein JWO82_1021 [Akkermansiaceae bacterium]|nr:hypothetical protein [Akkermansiaceae bacterium]